MGLFKKKASTGTTTDTKTDTKTDTQTDTTSDTDTTTTDTADSGDSGGISGVLKGVFGGSAKAASGANPVSSIIGSLSDVASAWINGDAKKKVAALNVESQKLAVEAEASKADQALYAALQEQSKTKANEATQLANQTKSNNVTNWVIVLGVLLLAFGVLYLVFKAVFGWVSPTRKTVASPLPLTNP